MFILKGKIQIGELVFHSINGVEITKSVEDLADMAVIRLPAKFRIRQNGVEKFTEETVKAGDKVIITLGYEDKYEGVEFTGFVASVGSKIPIEIKCEDAMWLLRRKNINKAFGKTTLKTILKEITAGTGIGLSGRIDDFEVDSWIAKNVNGAKALQDIKDNLMLSVYLDDEGKLYAGLQQLNNIAQQAVYDLNYNIVDNNLEYKAKEDRRIRVKYTYIDRKNHRTSVEAGDADGETRTFHTSVVSSEKQLKAAAQAELEKLKYDGFSGSVKSFLIPFATRGMAAVIKDSEHVNREGKYFINKVTTSFGTDGARREVHISNKL